MSTQARTRQTATIQLRNGMTARKMTPTRQHRPAIVPGILGTVYAINDQGEARYFDFDYAAAAEFAGLSQDADLRYARPVAPAQYVRSGALEANPSCSRFCVWMLREA